MLWLKKLTTDLSSPRWAKTAVDGGAHLLVHHGLDAAAVMGVLLERRPDRLAALADLFEMPPGAARAMLRALAGLHDLGKVAHAFQALRNDIAARLGMNPNLLRTFTHQYSRYRRDRCHHARLGQAFLMRLLERGETLPDGVLSMDSDAAETLLAAATGHHGFQPRIDERLVEYKRYRSKADLPAAQDMVAAFVALFGWDQAPSERGALRASYLTNGRLPSATGWRPATPSPWSRRDG